MSDEDRRQHPRVSASFPCVLVGTDGNEEAFDLIDLSESGVRMKCGSALTAMTRIQVAMVLPGRRIGREEDVKLHTTGVVVWSHRVEPDKYDTGVFFPELDEESRDLLQAFVLSAV